MPQEIAQMPTIIGAGKMAHGIGVRLLAGGVPVTMAGRNVEKARAAAEQLQSVTGQEAIVQAAPFGAAIADEVVILAIPYLSAIEILPLYAQHLAGKILVDVTNPLNASYDGLATPPTSSAAEEIAKLIPQTKVVKAFNTTFARSLVAGSVAGFPLDVFVASDYADAKARIAQLIQAGGLRAIDAGPLQRARQLEALGLLHITLQSSLGSGFGSAVKILV
jgi:NADPH-dependent F420 reductase